jgi:hypothetical protein
MQIMIKFKTSLELIQLIDIFINQDIEDEFHILSNLLYNHYMCNYDEYKNGTEHIPNKLSNDMQLIIDILKSYVFNLVDYPFIFDMNYSYVGNMQEYHLNDLGHKIQDCIIAWYNSKIFTKEFESDFIIGVIDESEKGFNKS